MKKNWNVTRKVIGYDRIGVIFPHNCRCHYVNKDVPREGDNRSGPKGTAHEL